MREQEYVGIVVRYQEYREHDAMLHILCENGQLFHVVARGIQKMKSKNAPACQVFTMSRFLLNVNEVGDLHSLKSAEIIESYRKIREDLYKQTIASYMCECLDASAFEEDVFPLLKTSLNILKDTSQPIRILCLFQSIMNRMHGIEPYVESCVRCGSNHNIYAISIVDGGFVCKQCYHSKDNKPKSIVDLKVFRLLCKAELEHYEVLREGFDFTFANFEDLYAFFQEYGAISIKSVRFLRKLYDIS
ncbi:DNA repair protein RecO [Amedibacillus sp. YH-ame10]